MNKELEQKIEEMAEKLVDRLLREQPYLQKIESTRDTIKRRFKDGMDTHEFKEILKFVAQEAVTHNINRLLAMNSKYGVVTTELLKLDDNFLKEFLGEER